ncbi:hypothetical protein M569_13151, partial [Genlisea aurea]
SNVPHAAPLSNTSATISDSRAPATPAKASGDTTRSFPLQFGSISPGIMNGVQIPARTSSAPPNLDEQKKSLAHLQSSKPAPAIPNPSLSRQHLPKKDGGNLDQSVTDEAHPISKSKRDIQPTAAPPMPQSQKPAARPIPSVPIKIPYHHTQLPLQFGGPSPQSQ